MGNNTSSTRKSAANVHHPDGVRKSSTLGPRHGSLDDEFSDLILHKVLKPQAINKGQDAPMQEKYSNQFSNDLIEDEFNELNDGLIETDPPEVSRNFLPNNDGDEMEIDKKEDSPSSTENEKLDHRTPTPDIANVDFTKIAAPPSNMSDVMIDTSYLASERYPVKKKGNNLIPVEIKWVNSTKEVINRLSIIGSFSNWRDIIRLKPSTKHPNEYVTTIRLPLGVHKLLYIINNEYRVSDQLPTATDQEGIFFNWFEVIDESHLFNHSQNQPNHIGASTAYDANIINRGESRTTQTAGKYDVDRINRKSNSFLAKVSKDAQSYEHIEYIDQPQELEIFSPPNGIEEENSQSSFGEPPNVKYYEEDQYSDSFLHDKAPESTLSYSNSIPEMYVNYDFFKNKSPNYELTEPPQLPAHLNNVLLNKMSLNEQKNHAENVPQYLDSSRVESKRPPLRRADSSYYASNKEAYHLSIPNHVILNHLMTTSIRNDVLTVACITRYSGKFVTQIMHSPSDP
ncbi:uncharacterized protein PRCAT00000874001 [Priceomyces carsonii]|uniref:uncharacterized protein n=1 Tax=Priceomyces carsonii TaxID=28549 RepID=UPI002EDBA8B9|nr:unnamed protein product [Priceomyces carsonii]